MASDGVDFTLVGMDELISKLDSVEKEIKRKGTRFGLRKAANLIASKAKIGAQRINDPATADEIAKNIAIRYSSRYFKAKGDHKMRIGIMGGARPTKKEAGEGLPGKDTRHWRFHELGTEKIRARPFMRPALENNISAAINEMAIHTDKAIDRALKRAKK